MGLKAPFIDIMTTHIKATHGKLDGLKIMEFGNQIIRPSPGLTEKTGKEYWKKQKMEHVSVDVNGLDGALKKDLSNVQDFVEYENYFDVVYNAGTSEHIEPYAAQYDCFQIADMITKPGGLMIHGVPEIKNRDISGVWLDHCRYYYSEKFFNTLAEESNYKILFLKVFKTNVTAVFQKTENSVFMKDKHKFLSNIAIRNEKINFAKNTNYIYQKGNK